MHLGLTKSLDSELIRCTVSSAVKDFTAELTFGRAKFKVYPDQELTHFDISSSNKQNKV